MFASAFFTTFLLFREFYHYRPHTREHKQSPMQRVINIRPRVVYRRSPHLVCYWSGTQLFLENYVARTRVRAGPLVLQVLELFDRWRPGEALAKHLPQFKSAALRLTLTSLEDSSLLERCDQIPFPAKSKSDAWKDWSPAAAFLHFSTKDLCSGRDLADMVRSLRQRVTRVVMPSPVKRYSKAPKVRLPVSEMRGEFSQVLLARRTWRKFSDDPVELTALSTLLGLSFGVRWWVDVPRLGRLVLKTSPSGGARHPIESYVLARRVANLSPGLYHYAPDKHCLERLKSGASSSQLVRYLAGQKWYGSAAALVLMTAVFRRPQWKYHSPRVYRAVLIEAGHLCQTFCLVATWLGLAPFCSMALADSSIEADIGIDGVSESVLYAAGVGTMPRGLKWAPWPTRFPGTRRPNPSFA
jgi:SagB-type dehydrogenase family enzyme